MVILNSELPHCAWPLGVQQDEEPLSLGEACPSLGRPELSGQLRAAERTPGRNFKPSCVSVCHTDMVSVHVC